MSTIRNKDLWQVKLYLFVSLGSAISVAELGKLFINCAIYFAILTINLHFFTVMVTSCLVVNPSSFSKLPIMVICGLGLGFVSWGKPV